MMRMALLSTFCLLLVTPLAAGEEAPATPQEKPFFDRSILFGLHRGGAHWRPEHTVETYQEAWEIWPGALLEADARVTSDGAVVLMHDVTVDRTTDGTGPVAGMTLEEVRQLDAGYDFTPDNGETYPYRGKGLKVPTLQEAFDAVPDAHWLIEAKSQPGVADALVEAVTNAGMEDRVLLASFDPPIMNRIRELLPNVATCYDFETAAPLIMALRMGGGAWEAYEPTDDVLSLSYRMISQFSISKEEVQKLQAKGIRTHLHTLNTEETLRTGIRLGFDGLLTDVPELMEQVFREEGLPVPGDELEQAANRE